MAEAPNSIPPTAPRSNLRVLLRRFAYPLVVIAIIAAVIWWIEYRPGENVSPTGERYGPVDLPSALAPVGAKIAAEEGALAPNVLPDTWRNHQFLRGDFEL